MVRGGQEMLVRGVLSVGVFCVFTGEGEML
jgi:hypothetical protein